MITGWDCGTLVTRNSNNSPIIVVNAMKVETNLVFL